MDTRIVQMALLAALLAACAKTPDAPAPAAAAPAESATAAAYTPEATATPVEAAQATADVGEDPSVWDNEGDPEGETPSGELSCRDNPLATHFFTLVGGNTVDDCGRKDAKVLAAFDALMQEAKPAESSEPGVPPLRQRLLSGPSAPGQPQMLDDGDWWYYSACQAHQCGSTQLSMLYSPGQARLVGRLVAECRLWWLGSPTDAQRALIEANQPVDEAQLRPGTGYCD